MDNYIDLLRNIIKNFDNNEFDSVIKKILSTLFDDVIKHILDKIFNNYYVNREKYIYCIDNFIKKK